MSTFVVIGAGTVLGRQSARKFSPQGYDVALLARPAVRLDSHVAVLADEGATAGRFVANVRAPENLTAAEPELPSNDPEVLADPPWAMQRESGDLRRFARTLDH